MIDGSIFETATGSFGYNIIVNGTLSVVQEHNPELDGTVPMTQEEAVHYANATISNIALSIAQDKLQQGEQSNDYYS